MKSINTLDLPVLKDIVVPGKKVPVTDELPPLLNDLQAKALAQQIDMIIKARLETVLQHATQELTTDIKNYLDKVLPQLVETSSQVLKKDTFD